MERFFKYFNGYNTEYYPVSQIVAVLPTIDGGLKIYFKNTDTIDPVIVRRDEVEKAVSEILGNRIAVNAVDAASSDLYDVYQEDDGSYSAEKAKYLVTCADGEIRSVNFLDGHQEFCEEYANYCGLYQKCALRDSFENLKYRGDLLDENSEA